MTRAVLTIFFLLVFGPLSASHIVGGDFYYKCLSNDTYDITLDLYRDCKNGNPEALEIDLPAYIAIYRGSSLFLIDSFSSESSILVPPNFSNDCINNYPVKCLNRVRIHFTKFLPASTLPYTVVYQRCCRNNVTANLIDPGGTGATFYITIPPKINDQCNNSAVFKNYPPQIICQNVPLSYDHSATDVDGDSLSYELCEAFLGGSRNDAKPWNIPPPPYNSVVYRSPYSALTPMFGNPPIQVDPVTGILTTTPGIVGVFCVTVCCHEWRNGVMINTVRRDFQMDVTNCSKAVVANTPLYSEEPNTYIVDCEDLTVKFDNSSSGGFAYSWDFGVPGITTDVSTDKDPTYTYPDTGTYVVKLVVNPGTTCPDSIERIVKVYPTFSTDFEWDGLRCPNEPIYFTDKSVSKYDIVNYWNWNFDDGNISSIPNPINSFPNIGKTFNVRLISGNKYGCRDTAYQQIDIPKVEVNAGRDLRYPQYSYVQLNATGASQYTWSPSHYLNSSTIPNPVGYFADTGVYVYTVTGVTNEGCKDDDDVKIYITTGPYFIVPSAFSPNQDGKNDFLEIWASGYDKLNYFSIYNRWGQKIFTTNDIYKYWDGTIDGQKCELSTYFWIANLTDLDGNERQFRGDVTIIR